MSVANVKSSDLVASGGYDGMVNLYKFDKDAKEINKLKSISGLEGCINQLKFSNTRGANTFKSSDIMLAASHSQEEKFGRWHVQPKAKTGITILRKTA